MWLPGAVPGLPQFGESRREVPHPELKARRCGWERGALRLSATMRRRGRGQRLGAALHGQPTDAPPARGGVPGLSPSLWPRAAQTPTSFTLAMPFISQNPEKRSKLRHPDPSRFSPE